MNWLVRFTLGLPARASDVAEIRAGAPELLEDGPEVRAMPVVVLVHPRTFTDDRAAFASEVRKWVAGVHEEAKGAEARGDRPEGRPSSCALAFGDPEQRFASFLALVARTHEGAPPARRVLVPDERLLGETLDAGSSPGFERLVRYLAAVGLGDAVTLLIAGGGKASSENRARFAAALGERFAPTRIECATPAERCSPFVYLVEDTDGAVRGVVGPAFARAGDGEIAVLGALAIDDPAAARAAFEAAPATRVKDASAKKKPRS